MRYVFLFALLAGAILTSGCTTLESTAIGAGGGAIIGNQMGGRSWEGAALGGLAGLAWGVDHSQSHRQSGEGSYYEPAPQRQMSAGEQAAYERGRSRENAAEQRRRERAAEAAGRDDARRENSWY